MLIAVTLFESALRLNWQDGITAEFSFMWLRDNARDSSSFDVRSHQREVFTAALPENIRPISAQISATGNALVIQWPDIADPVTYTAEFLLTYSQPGMIPGIAYQPTLWTNQPRVRHIPLDSLDHEPIPGASLARALAKEGFAVVTDCPTNSQSVSQIAGYLGYVRQTIYGGIWAFEADEAMADSAYTPKELRPHTDGSYSLDAPGAQILLCLECAATGGESILVDGYKVAEILKHTTPGVFHDLTRIGIEGCYQGDDVILRATRPVFTLKNANVEQVTFNNYDRAPMALPRDDMARMYQGIRLADQYFNDPAFQWRYTLKAGEALVFDNWRLLHGRSAYRGVRRMTGAYINREDVMSLQARLLGISRDLSVRA